MSILELTGAESCKKCGEKARAERDRLQTENAKLRELVRKVEHYEQYGCHECPHHDGCDAHTLYDIAKCTMQLEIDRDKLELGIEVDDA